MIPTKCNFIAVEAAPEIEAEELPSTGTAWTFQLNVIIMLFYAFKEKLPCKVTLKSLNFL